MFLDRILLEIPIRTLAAAFSTEAFICPNNHNRAFPIKWSWGCCTGQRTNYVPGFIAHPRFVVDMVWPQKANRSGVCVVVHRPTSIESLLIQSTLGSIVNDFKSAQFDSLELPNKLYLRFCGRRRAATCPHLNGGPQRCQSSATMSSSFTTIYLCHSVVVVAPK